jgi:signal recognition particle receptor subunit beta
LAILNTESNQIVIRLIYDGLALSGKTTTLRMLASSLDQDFYTPEERYGRTVFFDWVGYTGGLFEGYQIRCQIISVPGQAEWAPRRRHLIEGADVVVFVGDTTRGRFADSLSSLRSLHGQLQELAGPPVGIVFQANKRDRADAVPLEEIQSELGKALKGIAVVESVASEGSGIRQAFVFGVRLCLDRVRELVRTNSLPTGSPEVDSGEDMLRNLRAAEEDTMSISSDSPLSNLTSADVPNRLAGEALQEVFASEGDMSLVNNKSKEIVPDCSSSEEEAAPQALPGQNGRLTPPLLPQSDVPSGMIWPPVEGRLILSGATTGLANLRQLDNGDWTVCPVEEWRFYSYDKDVFEELSSARQTLIGWAHRHIAIMPVLTPLRCLVLAETGHGNWRLWQVIKVENSLLSLSREALDRDDLQLVADGIWGTSYMYLTAVQQFRSLRYGLPCSLDTISFSDVGIRYNGLIPSPSRSGFDADADEVKEADEGDSEVSFRAQMRSIISSSLSSRLKGLEMVIENISRRGDGSQCSKKAFELTCGLLREAVALED